jgi:hypothetical protein
MDERSCRVCGRDISHRGGNAKICTRRECYRATQREQKEFNKPNGRKCLECQKDLTGNYRRLCPQHQQQNEQRGNSVRWDWVDISPKRTFNGIVG